MCLPIRPLRAFGQHGRTIRVRRWVMMALTLGFSHIGSIEGFVCSAPYEDLTLKGG